jgi:hypothetical protein
MVTGPRAGTGGGGYSQRQSVHCDAEFLMVQRETAAYVCELSSGNPEEVHYQNDSHDRLVSAVQSTGSYALIQQTICPRKAQR